MSDGNDNDDEFAPLFQINDLSDRQSKKLSETVIRAIRQDPSKKTQTPIHPIAGVSLAVFIAICGWFIIGYFELKDDIFMLKQEVSAIREDIRALKNQ